MCRYLITTKAESGNTLSDLPELFIVKKRGSSCSSNKICMKNVNMINLYFVTLNLPESFFHPHVCKPDLTGLGSQCIEIGALVSSLMTSLHGILTQAKKHYILQCMCLFLYQQLLHANLMTSTTVNT